MPNWTKKKEYDFLEKLKQPREWAWEFLRRNAEYRKCWAEFQAEIMPLKKDLGSYLQWRPKSLTKVPDAWGYFPPRLKGEGLKDWQARAVKGDVDPVRRLLPEAYGLPWRLRCIRDPYSTPASRVRFLSAKSPPIWRRVEDVELGGTQIDENQGISIYAWIDLGLSLGPQIKYLADAAEHLQDELVKRHVIETPDFRKRGIKWWRPYIRILDADYAGAKPAQIASVLYPYRDNSIKGGRQASKFVTEQLEAAKRMTTRGYRSLIPHSGDITKDS
jgi:hypothetical protein